MIYPFEAWAEANLRIANRNGAEWTVFCLNPDHQEKNPSCSFNVEKGVWICYACGARGSLGNSTELLEGELKMQILRARLNKMMNPEEEIEVVVPESMLDRYKVKHPFWQSRGIDESTQEMFGLGFDIIADAATIPVRTTVGALKGVTRRFVDPEAVGTKYKYPKGYKAVQNVYACWMHEEYDMSTVVKTEGSIDALRLWQLGYPAVAFYGNSVSPQQLRILQEIGVQKVIDFSDNDKGGTTARERSFGYWINGRDEYYYKAETDMHQHFRMATVTNFFGKKDAGSMTDDQIVYAVESAEHYRIKKFVKRTSPKLRRRTKRDVLQTV